VTHEQETLNWELAQGQITFEQYKIRKTELQKQGKWGRKRGY